MESVKFYRLNLLPNLETCKTGAIVPPTSPSTRNRCICITYDLLDNEWWANSDCSQMKKDTSLATARKNAN